MPDQSRSRPRLDQAPRALLLVFWGMLLVTIDFRLDDLNLLPDLLGALLLVLGVSGLERLQIHSAYQRLMQGVLILTVLFGASILDATAEYARPEYLTVIWSLVEVAWRIASVGLCLAMLWLARAADLPNAAKSWKLTLHLFLWIRCVRRVLKESLDLLRDHAGVTIQATVPDHLGLSPLLWLLVVVLTLLHFMASTMRLRRAMQTMPEPGTAS